MRVVVRDKRYRSSLRAPYTLDLTIDYPAIPNDIPLTERVKAHYRAHHNNVGYATFKGLNETDIHSILSAVKRQQAHVNVDRLGNCAYYFLERGTF